MSTKKNNADQKQVSGDHYKSASQHWNLLPALGYGHEYYTGQAVKYLSRWRKKNGVRDVLKAQHFIEKLIELVDEHGDKYLPSDIIREDEHRLLVAQTYKKHLFKFFDANDVDNDTAAVCISVLFANSKSMLVEAAEQCNILASRARSIELEGAGIGATEKEPPVSLQFKFVEYVDGGTGIRWACNRCGISLDLGIAEPPNLAHVTCRASQKVGQ